MQTKKLSAGQKIFGNAFQGKCQKRYRHKKDVTFKDTATGREWTYKFDYEISNEIDEFRGIAKRLGADKCYITWTAMEGFVEKEVQL
jgi:hypothetical protein